MRCQKDITPIAVMLQQMRMYDERAQHTAEQIQAIIDAGVKLSDVKDIKHALGLLGEVEVWRSRARQCAVHAAPYVHPKLSPIQHKEARTFAVNISKALANPKDAMERYRSSLNCMPPEGDVQSDD